MKKFKLRKTLFQKYSLDLSSDLHYKQTNQNCKKEFKLTVIPMLIIALAMPEIDGFLGT